MPMAPAQPALPSVPPAPAAPAPQPSAGARSAAPAPALSDSVLISSVSALYREASNSKHYRLRRNAVNRDALLGIQDWSDKIPGQSMEFIPKTSTAIEQFASWFKRALTQMGPDWFEVLVPPFSRSYSGRAIRDLILLHLDDILTNDQRREDFSTIISDAARVGATESLIILKVHGNVLSSGNADGGPLWRLRIDLIPFESYFADPTGANLYEIHEFETDLWAVQQRAQEGLYDQAVVAKLTESMRLNHQEGDRRARGRNQSESTPPSIRKRITIREFWGTMLDSNGKVIMHNAVCAIANGTHVIRPLSPNPYLHNSSPFVVAPIIRVPFSTHHRALFDDASSLNFALNELHNLMIDGALASVWGVRQLRTAYLENPDDFSDGIPQGETISVTANLPPGEKVLETVTTGEVPQEAMAIAEMLAREFTAAALTNELRQGSLPDRSTKATELVQVDQNLTAVLDGIAGDLEKNLMQPLLRKVALLIAQFADKSDPMAMATVMGAQNALEYLTTPAPMRVQLTMAPGIKVRGLSAVLERTRNFQKLMALLQVVTTSPIFAAQFFTKYSPAAFLAYIMKTLQLDPSDFLRAGREENEQLARDIADMQMMAMMNPTMASQGGPPQPGAGGTTPRGEGKAGTPNQGGTLAGGNPTSAGINQLVNPMTGMPGVMQ